VSRPPWPGGEPGAAPAPTAEPARPPASAGPGPGARPDGAKRPPQPSLARTRSPWRTAFFAGLGVVVLLIGLGWVVFGSSLLEVRSVEVTGNHLVSASQVRGVAGIAPKAKMIGVNTQGAAQRVESINQVQSATVSKSWPNRIVITVHERTPALAVAVPGAGYDLIDRSGVMIRSVRTRPAGLPMYQTSAAASSLRGDPAVAAAATVLQEVPASVARAVTVVSATDPGSVQLLLSNGVTIVWGDTSRAQQKSTELSTLMHTHATYYDVSAPGTAVTK
jgi:cell division protein FtsQ